MPAKMNMKSVKDRLKDETLDLSLCDLEEVPVREIAAVRKASYLDLSSNLLVSLPPTFATLKQIVKLDLSRNNLTEIPENFGEMKQLRHLDLYANQISRLPLSLGELKNLRWLDLKENPLAPAVASVAGPCSNMAECQACAKNIVKYLSNAKQTIDEEKLKRLNSATANPDTENAANKKESKKKKKKSEEKDKKKNVNKTDSKTVGDKLSQSNAHNKNNTNKNTSGNRSHKNSKSRRSVCHQIILSLVWTILFFFTLFLMLAILPKYFEQQSKEIFNYVEARTGVPMKTFQRQSADALAVSVQTATEWGKIIYDTVRMTYEKHFK